MKNTRNKKVWTFPCFQWLSLFESDCQIKRQLQANKGTHRPVKTGTLYDYCTYHQEMNYQYEDYHAQT